MRAEYRRGIYLYINGKEVRNDIKSIKAEMSRLVNEQARMTIGSKEYIAQSQKIKALRGIIREHNEQLSDTSRAWRSIQKIGDGFNRYFGLITAGVASLVGVITSFRKTAEAANMFEERLDNLSALTGLTGRELEWLGEKAKSTSVSITESGVRIKQSANDIVDAYTKMGSKRPDLLKDKEALHAVTQDAIILSEAAKSDLEPAVEALATTLNQFNAKSTESARIINVLAAGSKIGAAEIPYISTAMEKAGTTANMMGLSIEQTTAMIEAIAPKFAQARVAGTGLDRVLLTMRKHNIGFKDGVFDMNRALDELRLRYANGESSIELFGTEHAKMAEVMLQAQGTYNQFTKEVTGTSVALEQAGINTNNSAAALAQAKNRVQLMYIEIGKKLAPTLVHSTNLWNYFLKAVMALPEFLRRNQLLLLALGGAILTLNAHLIKAIALKVAEKALWIEDIIHRKTAVIWMNAQAAAIRIQIALTGQATLAQRALLAETQALNAAMKLNPFGLVVGAISAVIVALKAYEKYNRTAVQLEKDKGDAVSELAEKNKALNKTYTEISSNLESLNILSEKEKKDLQDKIALTIQLAEAELELAEQKARDITVRSTKVTLWEFMTTWNADKMKEKARENGRKAASVVTEEVEKIRDRLNLLKEQQVDLSDIINAESLGDQIPTDTIEQLEARLSKYSLALKGAAIGGEAYIRIQKKITEVEKQLADARGASVPVDDKEKFDQKAAQVKAYGEIYKQTLRDIAESEKELEDDLEEMMKENLRQLTEESNMFELSDADRRSLAEYNYWLQSTYDGQREMLRQQLDSNEIAYQEYLDKIKALDEEAARTKIENAEVWADAIISLTDSVSKFYESSKNRELKAAGNDAKKKEAIERKYAQRQKNFATTQTIIEGIVEIAKINSNAGVNADLTQTLRALLTAAAVARTAANVAVIQSQQFARGKYPVRGAIDGRLYQAAFVGPVRTGIYNKPSLGLFSETEPEMVIDGRTTRNIMTNFPEILDAIQRARVPQYASGKYPSSITETHTPESSLDNSQLIGLLQATIRTLQQVEESHRQPAMVDFISFLNRQKEYDQIQSKVTMR
jgi:TP901 family phage tail tape measure protein